MIKEMNKQRLRELLFGNINNISVKRKLYRTSVTPPKRGQQGYVRLYDKGLNCFDVVKFVDYYPNSFGFMYFKGDKLMSSPDNVGRIWFTEKITMRGI